ncbi:MAG TPA: glycosyltransferase [Gemmatimonadaceae bacterium]|nr:glycosyltransferase [Gemmatimonadaceae bacterium]
MKLCVVSFKECWQDERGTWLSYGGFPLQMAAIGSLFSQLTLVIVRGPARPGGIPLPPATVIPLRPPRGAGLVRKLSVAAAAPHYLGTIRRAIKSADAVHTPLPGDIALVGMWLGLVMRKPLLARYGGRWENGAGTTLFNRVTRSTMRAFAGGRNIMLATGEGAIAPSPRMQWIFSTSLSRSELDRIDARTDRPLGDPPRLVYAGRLSPEKGVGNLLRALALLQKRPTRARPLLTIAGDGPERASLETLAAELGVAPSVRFVGQLDRGALSSALAQSDLCVQPSLTEGYSKAWLDAMAHGVPVLSSAVGAAKVVLGSNGERGWTTTPGDVEALATALELALTQRIDWPALRHRCREYAECRTLESWAARIAATCREQWGVNALDGAGT